MTKDWNDKSDTKETEQPAENKKVLGAEGMQSMQGYDPSKLEYRLDSPHADYQAYKDIVAADKRYELGQSAATADSLPDAINTTLAAYKEAQGSEETPMDEWFYKKHGRTPYTTDAYAKPTEEED